MKGNIHLNKILIPPKIDFYKELLQTDFRKNVDYTELVDSLFLRDFGVSKYISELKIYNFRNADFLGRERPESMYLNLADLDNISFQSENIPKFENYFSALKVPAAEIDSKYKYPIYYLIAENFIQNVDTLFFDYLKTVSGYSPMDEDEEVFSKKIGENVFLKFSRKRTEFNFFSIEGYKYPEFFIDIYGEKHSISAQTDISTFLFFPSTSFHLFYENSHKFIRDSKGQILTVENRDDEPIVFFDEGKDCFMLTNPVVSKIRYVKYIYYSTILLVHYISVFEEWFKAHLLPEIHELKRS